MQEPEPSPLPVGRKPRRGDVFETTIERFGRRGGVEARWGTYAVHLRYGVPGQRVRAEVVRRRRDRLEARTQAVVAHGSDEVRPRCVHFGTCGGCAYQNVRYERQLLELGRRVEDAVAPLEPDTVAPVLGAEEPWGYRNKMDFTFSTRRWKERDEPPNAPDGFALGLHGPARWRKVIDLERCEIQPEEGNPILASVRALAREHQLPAWDPQTHEGLLRHLVLRKGVRTGELMVVLVTSARAAERIDPYARALVRAHPEITTLVQAVHSGAAAVAEGEHEYVLHGPGVIHEELGGTRFRLSARSFFQTHTRQAERLLDAVAEESDLRGQEVVWDLYCGVGTLALHLAPRAHSVWGFELVEDAVADAERNAALNGVENGHFTAGDLARTLREPPAEAPAPDLCVIDPPRAGLHKRVVQALRELAPPRLVYVSCNVDSAVEDLMPLRRDGYRVRSVRPLDLFPHTPHVECVFTVERAPSYAGLGAI